ncbi:MAG: hypothetical protein M0R03_11515 [Novosphingobium sp.]|nr:hypothetical protein [Novosphingobium sp.]
MKKTYGYEESSHKNKWRYFKDKFKYPSLEKVNKARKELSYIDRGDIHVRYIGFSHKNKMIDIIGERIHSKNWVTERIGETFNNKELELAKKYEGYIVVYIDQGTFGALDGQIIELISLKDGSFNFPCSVCNGNKKQNVTVKELTEEGWKESKTEIECVGCKGKGIMNKEEYDFANYYNNIWCKCKDYDSDEVDFYDDNQHPEISKHHWRCRKCKKVVQLG